MTDSLPTAGLVCTEAVPCLFNVIEDETEHADPLATAKANPSVVSSLQQELKACTYTTNRA